MKMKLTLVFPLVLAAAIFSTAARAQTNSAGTNADPVANGYLQIQAQLHATQMAVAENGLAAADEARKNAAELAARLQSLEQTVAAQRASDVAAARQTQQLTLLVAGAFGLAGLGILLLMVYFQWRAFTQIANLSAPPPAQLVNAGAFQQLAAPGRAAVETSNARLLDAVGQLEARLRELEGGQKMLPQTAVARFAQLLDDGQKFLDAGQPERALESFDRFLTAQPDHAEALVKRALALEKLGRMEEALAGCDRAIAANGAFVSAYLHKGGLLNRLRRHEEALDYFERALAAQDKKSAAK